MAANAAQLTGRRVMLLQKYPGFPHRRKYPHRSVAFPEVGGREHGEERRARKDPQRRPLDRRRASPAPFPIPKNGYEAMWNHLLRFNGAAYESKYRNLTVDAKAPRDAGHRRRQCPGIPVLGPHAQRAPTPTGASSSPTRPGAPHAARR